MVGGRMPTCFFVMGPVVLPAFAICPQENGPPPTKSQITRKIWEGTEKKEKKHVYIFYSYANIFYYKSNKA